MRRLALFLLVAGASAFVAPRALAPMALRAAAPGDAEAAEGAAVDGAAEAGAAAGAAPEVNSGAEAVELLFKDPEGYKAARAEYDRKTRDDIMNEAPVDRAFFLQAGGVAVGSFAFGIFSNKQKRAAAPGES